MDKTMKANPIAHDESNVEANKIVDISAFMIEI